MKITLLGYMGVGKTTIGKKLADYLGLDFIDLDDYIESNEEKTINELFSTIGEIAFRKNEAHYLHQILDLDHSFVLALGGGTPCYANNMQLVKEKSDASFYLKSNFKSLSERLFEERSSRPMINHIENYTLLEDFVRKHLFERQQFYFLADYTIDTIESDINNTIQLITNQLKPSK